MKDDNEINERLERIERSIAHICAPSKKFITLKEACTYLDLSSSHLYKLTSSKQIPYYCPSGKKIYFKQEELDKWISNKKFFSNEEINRKAINKVYSKK